MGLLLEMVQWFRFVFDLAHVPNLFVIAGWQAFWLGSLG